MPGADSNLANTTCLEVAKHATLLEQAKAQARAAAFLGEADTLTVTRTGPCANGTWFFGKADISVAQALAAVGWEPQGKCEDATMRALVQVSVASDAADVSP